MKALNTVTLLLIAAVFTGCGTLPNGRGWGQDATLFPGWKRVREAAVNAATAPKTWIPAAAALVLQVDDMDTEISEWAADTVPVFGSADDAARASDRLSQIGHGLYLLTALSTPSGDEGKVWVNNKLKGIGIGLAAMAVSYGTTDALKGATGRTRPEKSDRRSFPSCHASTTAVSTMLASGNVEYLRLPTWGKTSLQVGLAALPYAAGWARVEANKHYPSDILVGVALGNFFGTFFNDAFLGIDSTVNIAVTVEPSQQALVVGLRWTF
ncbi:MAG TPA: phosphatase PAP2 family protein [Desulfatiglandales bacterium]|nr:phosphatase PAP2 family protein [Desulfatiglandales bacterium]